MPRALPLAGIPLYSVESRTPLGHFDVIAFTLQTEMHYPGVVKMLNLGGVTCRAADRSGDDPIVIGGGPCAFHPEPVAPFFDAFFLGDAGEFIPEFTALFAEDGYRRMPRRRNPRELARKQGV